MISSARPQTSQSRGPCKYYLSQRGCFAGNSCKFSHGSDACLTPYDLNKECRYYLAGYCRRGTECYFRHPNPRRQMLHSSMESDDEDDKCSICMETPALYGLLTDCSHIYCHACLKSWRDPLQISDDIVDAGVHKQCPMCRVPSRYVIPSSVFYKSGDPMKHVVIERYKQSMKKVPCRYFQDSSPNNRWCPFGRDCFYRHVDQSGQEFMFDRGAEHYMRMPRRRHHYRDFPRSLNLHASGPEPSTPDPEAPPNNNVAPETNPEVVSLVETLLREVSNFADIEASTNPAVAAQLNALVNRMLDLQISGPETDAGEDDDAAEDDNENPPPLEPIPLGSVVGSGSQIEPAEEESSSELRLEDSISTVDNEELPTTFERIRLNWEDESDDEPLTRRPTCSPSRSPTRVPLPCSPTSPRSHRWSANFASGHARHSSSISSQLALANPPQLSCLNEPENPERSEMIRCAILTSSPDVTPPNSAPSPAIAKGKEFAFDNEYQSDDQDMEELVRSVQRTLLGQTHD